MLLISYRLLSLPVLLNGNCLKTTEFLDTYKWKFVNILSTWRNSASFGSWRDAGPVSRMTDEGTTYLLFRLSIELEQRRVGILSWTWRQRSSCPWGNLRKAQCRKWEEPLQRPPAGGSWCFWGTTRKSVCLGHYKQGAK